MKSGTEELVKNVGKTIKFLRLKAEIKQYDLAEKVKITPSYLSSIENGHKFPEMSILESISKEFNITLSLLLMYSIDLKTMDLPNKDLMNIKYLQDKVKTIVEDKVTAPVEAVKVR
jgi:transcriptional regulator with XRE-family HTH domain